MTSPRFIAASLITVMLVPLGAFSNDSPNAMSHNKPQKIEGTWSGPGGVIVTEPCLDNTKKLCVKVVSGDDSKDSMADLKGQIIIKDLVHGDAPNAWEGRYVADGEDLQAKLTLKGDNAVQFSACYLGLLCEEQTYTRAETSKKHKAAEISIP